MATAQVMRPNPPGQPDINYTPDLTKHIARTKRRTESEKLETTLPPGFPRRLKSKLVWDGSDIGSKFSWVYELNDNEVQEIEAALVHFKC